MASPSAAVAAAAAVVKLYVTIPEAGGAAERRVLVLRPADASVPDVISSAYRGQVRAAAALFTERVE